MLESKRIETRQSEIRERMAAIQSAESVTAEQRNEVNTLADEYQQNETKFRAALISEDEERSVAGAELETREKNQWADLVSNYEVRQALLHLDEGASLSGQTAEVVEEMRSKGGYRGVPLPLTALEQRAGETTSGDLPDPTTTAPILGRLFPDSSMAAMGGRLINIGTGSNEYPVITDGVSSGWASGETGNVGGPDQVKTGNATLSPDHTLGVQAQITRKSLRQAGGIENAIRADMRAEIQRALDEAVFQGSGASGEPSGIVSKANSAYSITEKDVTGAAVTYGDLIEQAAAIIAANAAGSINQIRAMVRHEVWAALEAEKFDAGSGITLFDKIVSKFANVVASDNALAAPATKKSKLLLTTGNSPFLIGSWGGVDLIRDQFTKAHSGQVVITGLLTCDVAVPRPEQLRVVKIETA